VQQLLNTGSSFVDHTIFFSFAGFAIFKLSFEQHQRSVGKNLEIWLATLNSPKLPQENTYCTQEMLHKGQLNCFCSKKLPRAHFDMRDGPTNRRVQMFVEK
jgi:hypothetical protein